MTKRQIRKPLMSYRGSDGVWRHGLNSEDVDVSADDLERFDAANEPDKAKAPAKKAAPRRK
jgi:hypothetical protein